MNEEEADRCLDAYLQGWNMARHCWDLAAWRIVKALAELDDIDTVELKKPIQRERATRECFIDVVMFLANQATIIFSERTGELELEHTIYCLNCNVQYDIDDVVPRCCPRCGSMRIAKYDHNVAGSPSTSFEDFWGSYLADVLYPAAADSAGDFVERAIRKTMERFGLKREDVVAEVKNQRPEWKEKGAR